LLKSSYIDFGRYSTDYFELCMVRWPRIRTEDGSQCYDPEQVARLRLSRDTRSSQYYFVRSLIRLAGRLYLDILILHLSRLIHQFPASVCRPLLHTTCVNFPDAEAPFDAYVQAFR
jgi:hypothetical protein